MYNKFRKNDEFLKQEKEDEEGGGGEKERRRGKGELLPHVGVCFIYNK